MAAQPNPPIQLSVGESTDPELLKSDRPSEAEGMPTPTLAESDNEVSPDDVEFIPAEEITQSQIGLANRSPG
ncbi:MAG: hypothetical protein HC890_19180 [Chloroflexaceae bacterium]|nr:hypothetical protein [Chloroflexaceae bacterium]